MMSDQLRAPWTLITLALDVEAARLSSAFRGAGIPSLLLKGPVLQKWLYPGEVRPYGDIDFLVPAHLHGQALTKLETLGFKDVDNQMSKWEVASHARTLVDGRGIVVDLHTRLNAMPDNDGVWEALSPGSTRMPLGGGEVLVGRRAVQLLTAVPHAAQHGGLEAKPVEDLRRALRVVTPDQVDEAAALATQLRAQAAFHLGLSIVGAETRYNVVPGTPDLLARARAASGHRTPGVILLAQAASAPSLRTTLSIVARGLWPTREFLLARYGDPATSVLGRARLRVLRWMHQVRTLPRAVFDVRSLKPHD